MPGIGLGRDGCRTPMQWDAGDFAGFSTVEPWLPVADDFRSRNVEEELRDPGSIHGLYRRLIAARRQHAALSAGSFRRLLAEDDLLLFERRCGSETILIALNLGSQAISAALPPGLASGEVLVSGFGDREREKTAGSIDLRPDEGLVIKGTNPSPDN